MTLLEALGLILLTQVSPIGPAEYRERLRSIEAAVARQDLQAVHAEARSLAKQRVLYEGRIIETDATVLGPLAEAGSPALAREASVRLRALREALDSDPGEGPASPVDPALLESLRREEASEEISAGGKVRGPRFPEADIPRGLLDRLADLWSAIRDLLEKFLRWLLRLFMGGVGTSPPEASTRVMVTAIVVTVLGVLGILAVMAFRRRRQAPLSEAISAAPAMSAGDSDPLSRTTSEWERFALELMKSGRFREAIRAWYHAMLVSLFRTGTLHYRKDRTNWEYAFALPSTVPWRAEFIDATRTFEQEWYGRRDTASELAEHFQRRTIEMLGHLRGGGSR